MQRVNAQSTFTDLTVAELGGPRAREFFDTCQRQIPFDQLAASVADIFKEQTPEGGRPHWPIVTMLKVVFIQKCFGLSDPMAEEMLRDRISFRRFVGLSFDDATPDHSTISTFRKRLREDGSFTTDPCASKTFKHGRAYHGYRAHIATDINGIMTDFVYDSAAESEHTHFDHLGRDETQKIYADSGCRSKERVERLEQRGVFAGICHRRVKGQKELSAAQKAFNRMIAGVRAMVEHPFAWIKRMTGGRTRYRGITRNAFDFALAAVVYNFRRSFTIEPAIAS